MATAKPRDRREYVRLTVNLPSNPKLLAIDDPAAGWLYVTGICHAGEHLTDGVLLPQVVARLAGVPVKVVRALVDAGLWHEPGHGCGRCPQPPAGQVVIHDFLEHQRSRDEAEKAKRAARSAAGARWGKGSEPQSDPDANRNADRIPEGNADAAADGNAEAKAEEELPLLLTYVGRLAVGDARENDGPARPPGHLLAAWGDIAGPDVDLVREAARYLAHYADRPARDERAAWLGWLVKARDYMARQRGHTGQPLGCPECIGGWIPRDPDEAPAPCRTCKPHLTPVAG